MPAPAGETKKMTDPKEFNSLDELFRKTFDDLPETPASSGWDTPSPQVWDEVRVRLKPPHSGWSTKAIILVSGLAIVVLLGLYWTLTRPEQPADSPEVTPSTAVQTPPPAMEPAATPEILETETVSAPENRGKSATKVSPTRTEQELHKPVTAPSTQPAANQTERAAEEPGRVRPTGSVPLPGSQPVSPNTTVARQAEAWRKAPWAKPLAPLPSVLDTRIIRPVPQGLKNISAPKQEH